jgi:hypothetical protein
MISVVPPDFSAANWWQPYLRTLWKARLAITAAVCLGLLAGWAWAFAVGPEYRLRAFVRAPVWQGAHLVSMDQFVATANGLGFAMLLRDRLAPAPVSGETLRGMFSVRLEGLDVVIDVASRDRAQAERVLAAAKRLVAEQLNSDRNELVKVTTTDRDALLAEIADVEARIEGARRRLVDASAARDASLAAMLDGQVGADARHLSILRRDLSVLDRLLIEGSDDMPLPDIDSTRSAARQQTFAAASGGVLALLIAVGAVLIRSYA